MEPICSLHLNTATSWRGGERQTLLLVEGLRREGHQASIACPPASPLAERARSSGIPVDEIPLRGELDLSSVRQLRRLIQHIDPQILQLHTAHAHTIGLLANFGLRRAPSVIVQRRVDFSIYRSGTPFLTRFKYRHGVDRYIAISDKIAEVLQQDGVDPQRIRVVHSGVTALPDPGQTVKQLRDQLQLPDSAPLLGSVGALSEHKGHRYLIEAMGLLKSRQAAAHLVLIGDGEEAEAIDTLAQQNGIADRIHRVGFQDDVSSWLAALDLYIHPSLEEGLGTSILDALTATRAVIASAVGGIPEVIEEGVTGRLVAPADPARLAQVIDQLLDDPTTAETLATAGKQRVEQHFSAEAMVRGNLAVHLELIEQMHSGQTNEKVAR
ncbi:MAG TPA: glycosyltransferase [Planctomycetes bacterium]|nr:glycosyltransferase [Planctomycetota bacterium]